MSNIKKALAVALAAAMILSCSPLASAVSGLTHPDGTTYTANNGYTYGSDSFQNPTSSIWVDTSETTETWRLNGGAGSLMYGNYLTAASKSGIPIGCSGDSTIYLATAGEGIESQLKIVCKVYGASSASQISEMTLTQDHFTNFNAQETTDTGSETINNVSTPYVKYTWFVTPDSQAGTVCSAGPNTNLMFNISFKYGGMTYHTKAYGHTEYIYRPIGCLKYVGSGGSAAYEVRQCSIGMFYSAQARPEWAGTESNERGFFNFNNLSQASSGKLIGCGSESGMESSGFAQISADANGDYGTCVKSSTTGANGGPGRDGYAVWTACDGNKAVASIWIDKGYDHLGKGTSGSLTNGLNARLIIKNGEGDDNDWFAAEAIQFKSGGTYSDVQGSNSLTLSGVGSIGANTPVFTGCDNLTQVISAYGSQQHSVQNSWSYLRDGDMAADHFILFEMSGVGPSSSGANSATSGNLYSIIFTTRGGDSNRSDEMLTSDIWSGDNNTDSNGTKKNYNRACQSLALRFRVYNTAKLRTIVRNIDRGNLGNSGYNYEYGGYSYGGLSTATGTFTSVAKSIPFPQENMFTAATWSTFQTAYDKAKSILADYSAGIFTNGYTAKYNWTYTSSNSMTAGDEQKNIDNVCKDLVNAYNALALAPNPSIKINHVATLYDGTTVTAADSVTYTGWDSNGNLTGAANPATPFKNGVKVNIYALASLQGYEVSGVSYLLNATLNHNGTNTTLYNSTNTAVGTAGNPAEYTFNYVPKNNTLKVFPFNGAASIYIDQAVKTGQIPNFANIAAANGGYPGFNFTGYYLTGDTDTYAVSGNPIDTSTWKMPYQDTNVYTGWAPKPVDLHVVTSYGTNTVEATQTPTVTTTIAAGDLNDVTFSLPTPPTAANMQFVSYYADANYTVPITGNSITASYADGADYPITEVTSSSVMTPINNTVTIYALYADLSNKLFFEPAGGTMPTGYESGELSYTAGTPISYPVPTKEGYIFTGWVDENGTPISKANFPSLISDGAWTVTDSSTKTGVNTVPNGTITMSGATGIVCYATWAPLDVLLTYRLNIPSSERSRFNSPDSASNPYFSIVVDADSPVTADMLPNNPRRFGYIFSYWTLEGRRFQVGSTTPSIDSTLYASWSEAKDVAFADITSYIKYAGNEEIADLQHGTEEIEAAPGDIVDIKFTVCGNFYAGSSSFIFGYNKNFYEAISGVDVFRVNEDNDYISGIKAEVTEITNYPGSIADYTYSNDETANTGKLMIAIDPDVNAMGTYNTVDFRDDTYMIEIKLKIKSNAAQGSMGSVWLALDQLRSTNNVMGDLYISFTQNEDSLAVVETERVTFDTTPIATTVRIAETPRTPTTMYVTLPADAKGVTGYWAGTTKNENLTLTGLEGTEILSVTYADNTSSTDQVNGSIEGFPTPEKYGYELDGFYAYSNGQYDLNDEWIPGCYATEDQAGKTYAAKWSPKNYTYTFYNTYTDELNYTVRGTVSVVYDQTGVTPTSYVSNLVTEFIGWVPLGTAFTEANAIKPDTAEWDAEFTNVTVTGDKEYVAFTKGARKTPYVTAYTSVSGDTYTPVGTSITATNNRFQLTTDVQNAIGVEIRYGDTLVITEQSNIPATPAPGYVYISLEQVDRVLRNARDASPSLAETYAGYTFGYIPDGNVFTKANANGYIPVSTYLDNTVTTAPSYTLQLSNTSSPVIYVQYEGTLVNDIYNAGTGSWDNGTYAPNITVSGAELTATGRYNETYDAATLVTPHLVAPFGYSFRAWSTPATVGTYRGATHNAQYNAATVTIHYYADDGMTQAQTATSTFDASPTLSTAAPAKTGYNFVGWIPAQFNSQNVLVPISGRTAVTGAYDIDAAANDPENTVVVTNNEGVLTYDLYFIASYTAGNYDVIYKVDGAVQTELSQNVTFGSTYTLPQEPTKTGYTFDGWYDQNNSSTKVPAGTTKTLEFEGMTYLGTFVPDNYNVTFYANNGTSDYSMVSVAYDSQITEPQTLPTRAGYTLAGWARTDNAQTAEYTTGAGNNLPVLNETNFPSYGGVEFYAVWEPDLVNYTIEFYYQNIADNNYTVDSTKTIANDDNYKAYVGSSVSVPAELISANMSTGFNRDTAIAGDVLSGTIPATGTLVLKVYYNRSSYNLNTSIDGAIATVGTYKYGADLSGVTVAEPTKTGSYFTGWSPAKPATMPAENVTMVAVFATESYNISYDKSPATGTTPSGETVTYGQSYTLATTAGFVRNGYTFDGWYLDPNDASTKIGDAGQTITIADMGDNNANIVLKAKWTIASYTLSFNSDGGSAVPSQTVEYNAHTTAPATVPEKAGYTFDYWMYNGEETNWSTFTMPYFDVEMTAHWTPIQYTIQFEENGGSTVTDITQAYNSAVTKPADPEKEGYTFGGWYTTSSFNAGTEVNWEGLTMPLNGATYYAKWTINSYTITFNMDGGDFQSLPTGFVKDGSVYKYTAEYGTAITAPAAPVKEGYSFTAWSPELPATMPADGATVTAQWNVNTYTITYLMEANGAQYTTQEYQYQVAVTAPAAPTKTGFTFGEWSPALPAAMPAENITVAATWIRHSYSLEYNFNGGTNVNVTTPVTVDYEQSVTLPVFGSNFTNTGYSFDGWYYNGTKIDAATFSVPAQSQSGDTITLTAQYTQNEYNIYYKEADGTIISTSPALHYNDNIAAYNTSPTKAGYDFAGWYSDAALNTPFNDWSFMPASDLIVYAKWNEHEYTVTFAEPDSVSGAPTFNNGNVYLTLTGITLGDTIAAADTTGALASNPAVNNYTFLGWTLDPNADPAVIITAAEIGAWTIDSTVATLAGDEVIFYPVYERETIELEINSDAEVVVDDTVTPNVNYIYNAGDKQRLAALNSQLDATGAGDIIITPSKMNFCGSGTRVDVIDTELTVNPENPVIVATYYLVVFGDVEGDASCTALDYGIIEGQIAKDLNKRTWELADDDVLISELTEEEQMLCSCYVRAADADANGQFDLNDPGLIQLYVLKVVPYEFDDEKGRYVVVTD